MDMFHWLVTFLLLWKRHRWDTFPWDVIISLLWKWLSLGPNVSIAMARVHCYGEGPLLWWGFVAMMRVGCYVEGPLLWWGDMFHRIIHKLSRCYSSFHFLPKEFLLLLNFLENSAILHRSPGQIWQNFLHRAIGYILVHRVASLTYKWSNNCQG